METINELCEIVKNKTYTSELSQPKDLNDGLSNFIQMAINDIEKGKIREALLKLVDLKNDIGSAYNCK